MWHRLGDLREMQIGALDGDIGTVTDVYFDDAEWTVRYLAVEMGSWLSGRKVLISPFAVRDIEADARRILVSLSSYQVSESPVVDLTQPIERRDETRLFDHYGYPYYWSGPFVWGPLPFPDHDLTLEHPLPPSRSDREREHYHPNLRSASATTGYRIEATDGAMGQVEDYLYDPTCWGVRYLVLDTRHWLAGKHVLVATSWVQRVSTRDRRIHVELSRDAVRSSPDFDICQLSASGNETLAQNTEQPRQRIPGHSVDISSH